MGNTSCCQRKGLEIPQMDRKLGNSFAELQLEDSDPEFFQDIRENVGASLSSLKHRSSKETQNSSKNIRQTVYSQIFFEQDSQSPKRALNGSQKLSSFGKTKNFEAQGFAYNSEPRIGANVNRADAQKDRPPVLKKTQKASLKSSLKSSICEKSSSSLSSSVSSDLLVNKEEMRRNPFLAIIAKEYNQCEFKTIPLKRKASEKTPFSKDLKKSHLEKSGNFRKMRSEICSDRYVSSFVNIEISDTPSSFPHTNKKLNIKESKKNKNRNLQIPTIGFQEESRIDIQTIFEENSNL